MTSQRTYKHDITPMKSTYSSAPIKRCNTHTHKLNGELTRNRSTSLLSRNQNKMINPDMPNNNTHVLRTEKTPTINQLTRKAETTAQKQTHKRLLRAHQSVNIKNTARTRLATLLALVSNPHAISAAPIRPEPRYPAGSVSHCMPPDILVAPPSSAAPQPVPVSFLNCCHPWEVRTYDLTRLSVYART